MPLVPEGIITMLACARIGAIHSVVFAGMGMHALRSRIEDSGAKVVVCSDYAFRRGKKLPLKGTVDEAVRDLTSVEHVIVHRRGSRPGDAPFAFESERECDFYDVQEGREIHCEPVPMGADVAVVDAKGNEVKDGEGGLLVLRRPLPYMLRTVWGDPARYENYWSQIPGYYCAGDLSVRDADGYFAVLGRADDVMNVAGHRIGTADVESSLLRHSAVAESAVIGLPDALKGEKIKAFVVLKPGKSVGPALVASLKDHVRQDLGPIATPSEIEMRESLPKTRSGKIVRRFLKAQAMGEDPGDLSTLAD